MHLLDAHDYDLQFPFSTRPAVNSSLEAGWLDQRHASCFHTGACITLPAAAGSRGAPRVPAVHLGRLWGPHSGAH